MAPGAAGPTGQSAWPLVDPGLVHLPLWRPGSPLDLDGHPERFGALAGIGRKDAAGDGAGDAAERAR